MMNVSELLKEKRRRKEKKICRTFGTIMCIITLLYVASIIITFDLEDQTNFFLLSVAWFFSMGITYTVWEYKYTHLTISPLYDSIVKDSEDEEYLEGDD